VGKSYKKNVNYSNKNISNKYKQSKSSDAVLIALICVLAIAVAIVAVVIAVNLKAFNNASKESAEFIPPKFDEQAEKGKPTVAEEMGYLEVYKEGMSFNAFVCGEVNIIDGKADIYFTNPEKNTLWMKLRIFDEKGNVIAETGLIKPDEYLKTVSFDKIPSNNSMIIMKIMSYEPDTYYSGGAVSLSTVAKVK
jgi:hypothetical protein